LLLLEVGVVVVVPVAVVEQAVIEPRLGLQVAEHRLKAH
jgi:hypothetical protein